MKIVKGKYYRYNDSNGFTVKALADSHDDDTFSAVVVLKGRYSHNIGEVCSRWSSPSFVESDLSEFIEEANKRYPRGSLYKCLKGNATGEYDKGYSSVEYSARIWYYEENNRVELRGVDMGNYVVYNFLVDKWAEPFVEEKANEEFDMSTNEGRLAYAKKHYPIGTKYKPLDFQGRLFSNTHTSYFEPINWKSGSSIECGNGLIYTGGKWAEIVKEVESKKETIMETQKLTRQGLKKIHAVACDGWKKTLEDYGKRNPLEDYIELSQKEVDEMFKACNGEQKLVVSEHLKQTSIKHLIKGIDDDELRRITNRLIKVRFGGEYGYASFTLNDSFDWEIKEDNFGYKCLVPTIKK